jgi:hypothetical protein
MGPLAFLLSLARIIIAVLLVVLSPTVAISDSAASWIAYISFLIQGLVLLLLLFVITYKFFELIIRVLGSVPFDESRSPRGGGLFGALRKLRGGGTGGKKRRGGAGGGGATAKSNAARRRAIEERRRRNLHREQYGTGASDRSSVQTRTHMLPSAARPAGHSRTSLGPSHSPFPSAGLDEDGYIMSAMSSRGWDSASEASSQRPGFVKPGSYAAGGPILRSVQQHWGHSQVSMSSSPAPASAIIVPAAAVSSSQGGGSANSSFSRVGGGKASHSNPYKLVQPPGSNAYPPYPPTTDLYGPHTPALGERRGSQSGTVEFANASSHSPNYIGGVPTRPSLSLPSSSALLSNSVSPAGGRGRLDDEHNRRPSARVRKGQFANQGGFFGRFKKQRAQYSDDEFTESDTDDENTSTRKGGWGALAGLGGLRGGRKKKGGRGSGDGYSSAEDAPPAPVEAPSGETGFSVVRKPRPRPSPTATSTSGGALGASTSSSSAPPPKATDFASPDTPTTPTTPSHSVNHPLLPSSSAIASSTSPRPSLPPGARAPASASSPPPPHVSVEAPSRPGSLRGEASGVAWEEREE